MSQQSMISVENIKSKIKNAVKLYIKTFPEEYVLVVDSIRQKRGTLADERFGTLTGGDHFAERALYEIPEKLDSMLNMNLTSDELEWYKSKKAAGWFAKTFPQFRLPDEI